MLDSFRAQRSRRIETLFPQNHFEQSPHCTVVRIELLFFCFSGEAFSGFFISFVPLINFPFLSFSCFFILILHLPSPEESKIPHMVMLRQILSPFIQRQLFKLTKITTHLDIFGAQHVLRILQPFSTGKSLITSWGKTLWVNFLRNAALMKSLHPLIWLHKLVALH